MPFDPVDPRAERYMRELASRHDEPVLLEMERLAEARGFPIVGRLVGELLEVLARSIGRWDRVDYRVGRAQDALRALPGPVDVVYCDVDKAGYPEAWELARDRIRPGGLYVCDNVLWSGLVADADRGDERPDLTAAIWRHNAMVYADPGFDACLVPTRDGVLVARRR